MMEILGRMGKLGLRFKHTAVRRRIGLYMLLCRIGEGRS